MASTPKSPLRWPLAVALVIVGGVLMTVPTLAHDPGPAADTFAAIERRIPWGGVLGLGLFVGFRPRPASWGATAMAFIWTVALGLLLARLVGLALDDPANTRQWVWVAVEAVVVGVAGIVAGRLAKVTASSVGGRVVADASTSRS
ncbi:MAG: DUF4345 family protein [Nannocystaceae bacterium]